MVNTEACLGGGYVEWTMLALCTETSAARWALWIPLAVFAMLCALLLLGTATDEYLCPSISSIVNQLKISQNVAVSEFHSVCSSKDQTWGIFTKNIHHLHFRVSR